jgi:hypothetical protein
LISQQWGTKLNKIKKQPLTERNRMKLFGNVFLRIVATFVASALGVIGAGAIGGVPPVLAATRVVFWQ